MALTPSTMLALGTEAPTFSLINTVNGEHVSIDECVGPRGLLVMFICNHCPYVIHLKEAMTELAQEAQQRGFGVVGINSNDISNPKYADDRPELMKEDAERFGYTFPYCFDEDQSVARAYRAACTPDFFLFDAQRSLAYRGRFDGSRPGNDEPITGQDLRNALQAVEAGEAVSEPHFPSMGCNIKWKPGLEPDYA